jgi:hypothetical protein
LPTRGIGRRIRDMRRVGIGIIKIHQARSFSKLDNPM